MVATHLCRLFHIIATQYGTSTSFQLSAQKLLRDIVPYRPRLPRLLFVPISISHDILHKLGNPLVHRRDGIHPDTLNVVRSVG